MDLSYARHLLPRQVITGLDLSFGEAGVLQHRFPEGPGGSQWMAAADDSSGYLVLSLGRVEDRIGAHLTMVTRKGTYRSTPLSRHGATKDLITVCGAYFDNILYFAGSTERNGARISALDCEAGGAWTGFGILVKDWILRVKKKYGVQLQIGAVLPAEKSVMIAGSAYLNEDPQRRGPFAVRFDRWGNLDTKFQKCGGIPRTQPEYREHIVGLTPTGESGRTIALLNAFDSKNDSVGLIAHLDADGSVRPTPNWPGWFTLLTCCTQDRPAGKVLLGGTIKPRDFGQTPGRGYRGRICRLRRDAEIDDSFGDGGSWVCRTEGSQVRALLPLLRGDVIAAGSVGDHPAIFMLTDQGEPYEGFGDGGTLILSQLSGTATSIARTKPHMGPDQVVVNISTKSDGVILVAFLLSEEIDEGYFTRASKSMESRERTNAARPTSTTMMSARPASLATETQAAAARTEKARYQANLSKKIADSHAAYMGAAATSMNTFYVNHRSW